MDTTDVFSSKAEKYDKYRLDYAAQAIEPIFAVTQLSPQAAVADIGAGTGILTGHFIGQVRQVFAVEPNAEMRGIAQRKFGDAPGCDFIGGRAEATTLPPRSIDLISVGQAIHWFEPQATRAEFLRVLKPDGWLALLKRSRPQDALTQAVQKIFPAETDTEDFMIGRGTPSSFYYGHNDFLTQTFPFTAQQTWPDFIGGLSTASYAPDEDSPLYHDFEQTARHVFDNFSQAGVLEIEWTTELQLGKIVRPAVSDTTD